MALVIKARSAGLLLLIFLRIRQQCGRLQILRRTENRQSAQLTVGANSFARGQPTQLYRLGSLSRMNSLPQAVVFTAKTALVIPGRSAPGFAVDLLTHSSASGFLHVLRRTENRQSAQIHCGSEFIREGAVHPTQLYRLGSLSRMNSLPQAVVLTAKTALVIKAAKRAGLLLLTFLRIRQQCGFVQVQRQNIAISGRSMLRAST
ncbi:MAG: hypothetical protein ACRER8_06080 [Pseudomonas sp.]|uniref:hypothetical protein n=1 Tax=Pseudomonas sp. TaxID=306 RepID=UPI003D6EA7F9